jgi:hypothetical protein
MTAVDKVTVTTDGGLAGGKAKNRLTLYQMFPEKCPRQLFMQAKNQEARKRFATSAFGLL